MPKNTASGILGTESALIMASSEFKTSFMYHILFKKKSTPISSRISFDYQYFRIVIFTLFNRGIRNNFLQLNNTS